MADDFPDSSEQALQRFMAEFGITDRDKAMRRIVQDWLISHGYTASGAKSDGVKAADDGRDPDFVQYPSYYKDGGSI
jgi:hypothetical protein